MAMAVFAGSEMDPVSGKRMATQALDQERVRTHPKDVDALRRKVAHYENFGGHMPREMFEADIFSGIPGQAAKCGIAIDLTRHCDRVMLKLFTGLDANESDRRLDDAASSPVMLEPETGGSFEAWTGAKQIVGQIEPMYLALTDAELRAEKRAADIARLSETRPGIADILRHSPLPPRQMLDISIDVYSGTMDGLSDNIMAGMSSAAAATYCMQAVEHDPFKAMPSRCDVSNASNIVLKSLSTFIDGDGKEQLARCGIGKDESGSIVVADSSAFARARRNGSLSNVTRSIVKSISLNAKQSPITSRSTSLASGMLLRFDETEKGKDGAPLGMSLAMHPFVHAEALRMSHSVAIGRRHRDNVYSRDILTNAGVIAGYGSNPEPTAMERMVESMRLNSLGCKAPEAEDDFCKK